MTPTATIARQRRLPLAKANPELLAKAAPKPRTKGIPKKVEAPKAEGAPAEAKGLSEARGAPVKAEDIRKAGVVTTSAKAEDVSEAEAATAPTKAKGIPAVGVPGRTQRHLRD